MVPCPILLDSKNAGSKLILRPLILASAPSIIQLISFSMTLRGTIMFALKGSYFPLHLDERRSKLFSIAQKQVCAMPVQLRANVRVVKVVDIFSVHFSKSI